MEFTCENISVNSLMSTIDWNSVNRSLQTRHFLSYPTSCYFLHLSPPQSCSLLHSPSSHALSTTPCSSHCPLLYSPSFTCSLLHPLLPPLAFFSTHHSSPCSLLHPPLLSLLCFILSLFSLFSSPPSSNCSLLHYPYSPCSLLNSPFLSLLSFILPLLSLLSSPLHPKHFLFLSFLSHS